MHFKQRSDAPVSVLGLWGTVQAERLRSAAGRLDRELAGLDYYQYLELKDLFNEASLDIFRPFRVPEALANIQW